MAADGNSPLRVFLAEDESIIAMDLEATLTRAGHAVVGTAQSLGEALEAAAGLELDVALLDVNLAGERIFPVADILAGRGLPFVFLTGYGGDLLPPRFGDRAVIRKPYSSRGLLNLVERVGRG